MKKKALVLGLSILTSISFSYADINKGREYTRADARNDNLKEAAIAATVTTIIGSNSKYINNLAVDTFYQQGSLHKALNDADIKLAVDKMEKSMLAKTALGGSNGGNTLLVKLDIGQVQRILASENLKNLSPDFVKTLKRIAVDLTDSTPPKSSRNLNLGQAPSPKAVESALDTLNGAKTKMKTIKYNTRFHNGGIAGIKAELVALKDAGVKFSSMKLKTIAKGMIPGLGNIALTAGVIITMERGIITLAYSIEHRSIENSFCSEEDGSFCRSYGLRYLVDAGFANADKLTGDIIDSNIAEYRKQINVNNEDLDNIDNGKTQFQDYPYGRSAENQKERAITDLKESSAVAEGNIESLEARR